MKAANIVLAALLAGSLIGTAQAASTIPDSSHQRVVRFGDLDLSKKSDAQKLRMRIRIAAQDVCGVQGVSSILYSNAIRLCAKDAAQRAIAEVNTIVTARGECSLCFVSIGAPRPRA